MKKYFFFSVVLCLFACQDKTGNQKTIPQLEQVEEQVEEQKRSPEIEVNDLIQVDEPKSGDTLSSPVSITGKARGTWFFEGDFPIYLVDKDNNQLAVAIATAEGDWMTENWVDFTATLEFDETTSEETSLRFEKNNPSDRRELDRSYELQVQLK